MVDDILKVKLDEIDAEETEVSTETEVVEEPDDSKEKETLITSLKIDNEIKIQKLRLIRILQEQWFEKENNNKNSRDKIIDLFTKILSVQLTFLALIVILTAIKTNNFGVSDTVMTIIAGSLITEIISVFLIIAKCLFDNQNDKLLDIIEKIIGKY